MEYRSEGLIGSLTSFLSCCMDGGRPLVPLRVERARARAAFGFVINALFSCSNLAKRKAIDYVRSQDKINDNIIGDLPHRNPHPEALAPHSSQAHPSRPERCRLKKKSQSCRFGNEQ